MKSNKLITGGRLLGVNKDVLNVVIREYIKPDETRYFTATILKWKNFKFYPSGGIKSTQLLTNFVIPKVREIRDKLKDKTLDEQMKIVDEIPTEFTYGEKKYWEVGGFVKCEHCGSSEK